MKQFLALTMLAVLFVFAVAPNDEGMPPTPMNTAHVTIA